ncbi:MAG TPA: ATP-binding protein, partial [Actinomycetota bacterium]|nr:ATP-binding protein [Actinomycetota bacterium]
VQNSYDIVTVLGTSGKIDYISPSVERVLGYKPEDMIGDVGPDYAHEDDRALVAQKLAEVVRSPDGIANFVVRVRHADGTWRWLEVTLHNLLSNPSINGIVAHQSDITDRREAEDSQQRLEEQLRQSQKLEAVGQLAGGVAHDFNNLLSVIQNFARFVYDDMEESDTRRDDMAEIIGAGDRATNLVRQLLTFSRKDLIRPEVWDLNGIVEEMAKLLSRTIPENVELDLKLGNGPIFVHVDRGQIEQVIMNIALNARDAMSNGGSLTVTTSSHLVDVIGGEAAMLAPGEYARLTMTDTGVGMDAATQGRVFEPFFTTKSRDSGTGLGLATVYGIVEHAGGHVFVQSEVGKGTTLDVYIPLEPAGALIDEAPSTRPMMDISGRETILVAEDEKGVRSVVERVLTRKGFRVLSADSGEKALKIARTHPGRIDLLLTDLVMPGMSGTDLSARLPELEVVYMSGYSEEILSRQGVAAEGSFLQKPFSPEALLNKVRDALDAHTREPQNA